MDPDLEQTLEYVNLILTIIFFIEMLLKMFGQGINSYLKDNANLLDMIIVILSLADVSIYIYSKTAIAEKDLKTLDTLRNVTTVFRIFRLARILKLAKSWSNFNYFLITIASTLTKISAFALILFLFIFIFAMMGMEFYAQKVRFNFDDEPIEYFGKYENTSVKYSVPANNFDNFINAMLTVYVVLANDGWAPIYH